MICVCNERAVIRRVVGNAVIIIVSVSVVAGAITVGINCLRRIQGERVSFICNIVAIIVRIRVVTNAVTISIYRFVGVQREGVKRVEH